MLAPRRPDYVRRLRVTLSQRGWLADGRVFSGLLLGLGIDRGTQQDNEGRQVQPGEQNDDAAEGAVGFVVAVEIGDVDREGDRAYQPQDCSRNGSWGHPPP